MGQIPFPEASPMILDECSQVISISFTSLSPERSLVDFTITADSDEITLQW